MKDLVLHPETAKTIESFKGSPSHAVLLSGPAGSGKHTLAFELALSWTGSTELSKYPYKLVIEPEPGKMIGIDTVRELDHFLSLKVPGGDKRAVIIEDAHSLSDEAQNALLKPLEEPPADSIIVLTSSNSRALLPTVRSRCQTIEVAIPEPEQLVGYFKQIGKSDKDIQQAFAISGGLPGLMTALLNDEDHPLKLATDAARELLSQSTFERLLKVDELAKDRQLAMNVTFILQQMAHVSLLKASGKAAQRWHLIMAASYDTSEALQANAQPKLALANLMLNL